MKKSIFTTLALTLFCAFSFSFKPTDGTTGYAVGDMARDFSLKNVDGKMVSLSDYKTAKGIIVVFTCNHCPFAQAYEDRVIALHKMFSARGYPVVAINPNDANRVPEDSYEAMKTRAKEHKYPFAYLHDETQEIAKTYGAMRTPHVYLLTKQPKGFRVEYIGAIDDNSEEPRDVKEKYVEAAIHSLMTGKPVEKTSTKAIGCTIKWRK